MHPERPLAVIDESFQTWVVREIKTSVLEANDPNSEWILQSEVRRESALRRAKWLGQLGQLAAQSRKV